MASFFDRLKSLQTGNQPSAIMTAQGIRRELNDGKLGCGCLLMILAALFGVYWLGTSSFHSNTLALIAASVVAVLSILALQVRKYHVWTGLAWTGLAIMGVGVAAWIYALLDPAEALQTLPAFLTRSWMPAVLSITGAGVFGYVSVKMRGAISSPEAQYAIQYHAAARQVDLARQAEVLRLATERLELAATAGAFPLSWETIALGDEQKVREDAPGPHYLPILAVSAVPNPDEPWTATFDGPFLAAPDALQASLSTLAPISVGVLYCTREHLVYAPLRNKLELIQIPLADLTRYRATVNGLMVGTATTSWSFGAIYAWRMLALIAFLRAFEADADAEGHDLHATAVRRGARPGRMVTRGAVKEARARLDALDKDATATAKTAMVSARALLGRDEPALQFIGVTLADAWDAIHAGSTSIDVDVALHEAATLAEMLTSRALPDDIDVLIADLHACWFLNAARWPELLNAVAEWTPLDHEEREDRIDRGDDEDDDEDDDDPTLLAQEALVEVVRALDKGRTEAAAKRLAEAREHGFKGTLLAEALARATTAP